MTEWTEWDGGECPIPDAKAREFYIKLRFDPDKEIYKTPNAIELRWSNTESLADIIAYRLIEKEQSDLDWLEERVRSELLNHQNEYVSSATAYNRVLSFIKQRRVAKP